MHSSVGTAVSVVVLVGMACVSSSGSHLRPRSTSFSCYYSRFFPLPILFWKVNLFWVFVVPSANQFCHDIISKLQHNAWCIHDSFNCVLGYLDPFIVKNYYLLPYHLILWCIFAQLSSKNWGKWRTVLFFKDFSLNLWHIQIIIG